MISYTVIHKEGKEPVSGPWTNKLVAQVMRDNKNRETGTQDYVVQKRDDEKKKRETVE